MIDQYPTEAMPTDRFCRKVKLNTNTYDQYSTEATPTDRFCRKVKLKTYEATPTYKFCKQVVMTANTCNYPILCCSHSHRQILWVSEIGHYNL